MARFHCATMTSCCEFMSHKVILGCDCTSFDLMQIPMKNGLINRIDLAEKARIKTTLRGLRYLPWSCACPTTTTRDGRLAHLLPSDASKVLISCNARNGRVKINDLLSRLNARRNCSRSSASSPDMSRVEPCALPSTPLGLASLAPHSEGNPHLCTRFL